MAEKALRRVGIDPSASDERTETTVAVASDRFTIQRDGSAVECRSIAELLDALDR